MPTINTLRHQHHQRNLQPFSKAHVACIYSQHSYSTMVISHKLQGNIHVQLNPVLFCFSLNRIEDVSQRYNSLQGINGLAGAEPGTGLADQEQLNCASVPLGSSASLSSVVLAALGSLLCGLSSPWVSSLWS